MTGISLSGSVHALVLIPQIRVQALVHLLILVMSYRPSDGSRRGGGSPADPSAAFTRAAAARSEREQHVRAPLSDPLPSTPPLCLRLISSLRPLICRVLAAESSAFIADREDAVKE